MAYSSAETLLNNGPNKEATKLLPNFGHGPQFGLVLCFVSYPSLSYHNLGHVYWGNMGQVGGMVNETWFTSVVKCSVYYWPQRNYFLQIQWIGLISNNPIYFFLLFHFFSDYFIFINFLSHSKYIEFFPPFFRQKFLSSRSHFFHSKSCLIINISETHTQTHTAPRRNLLVLPPNK